MQKPNYMAIKQMFHMEHLISFNFNQSKTAKQKTKLNKLYGGRQKSDINIIKIKFKYKS